MKYLIDTNIILQILKKRSDKEDSIQYKTAKEHNLTLVTLDEDFFKVKLDIKVFKPNQIK